MVQVGTGSLGEDGKTGIMGSIEMPTGNEQMPAQMSQSPANVSYKKSPSYHSNKSETQMSLDNTATRPAQQLSSNSLNNISPAVAARKVSTVPSYEDHWTYEQIILERAPGVSLGFSIAGGTDNPMYGNNTAIFITKLTPSGLAEQDGRLRPNDILFKVNGVSLEDAEHSQAVQALKEAGQLVNLVT